MRIAVLLLALLLALALAACEDHSPFDGEWHGSLWELRIEEQGGIVRAFGVREPRSARGMTGTATGNHLYLEGDGLSLYLELVGPSTLEGWERDHEDAPFNLFRWVQMERR